MIFFQNARFYTHNLRPFSLYHTYKNPLVLMVGAPNETVFSLENVPRNPDKTEVVKLGVGTYPAAHTSITPETPIGMRLNRENRHGGVRTLKRNRKPGMLVRVRNTYILASGQQVAKGSVCVLLKVEHTPYGSTTCTMILPNGHVATAQGLHSSGCWCEVLTP